MLKIKSIIQTRETSVIYDENIKRLLTETDSLFKKAAVVLKGEIVKNGAGNPVNLSAELQACKCNFEYLQNVIRN